MGFSKIIGTPHTYPGIYNNSNESIYESFKKVSGTNIKLEYASEYMIDDYLIYKAENKTILCLKDNYVLVEMSFINAPSRLYEILFKVQLKGYIPVLAHPERYMFFYDSIDNFFKLKSAGCKFQLNLLSLTGFYGVKQKKLADKLLENNLINFVGSDIHNRNHIIEFEKRIRINNIKKLEKIIEANNFFED